MKYSDCVKYLFCPTRLCENFLQNWEHHKQFLDWWYIYGLTQMLCYFFQFFQQIRVKCIDGSQQEMKFWGRNDIDYKFFLVCWQKSRIDEVFVIFCIFLVSSFFIPKIEISQALSNGSKITTGFKRIFWYVAPGTTETSRMSHQTSNNISNL